MDKIKYILKILTLYLIIIWFLGVLHYMFFLDKSINDINDLIQGMFNSQVFYLYFIVVFFELVSFFKEEKKNKTY
jgi:hypothetical protein